MILLLMSQIYLFFRLVLLQCGEVQCGLAGELANCDMEVDENVLGPLTKVLDVSEM